MAKFLSNIFSEVRGSVNGNVFARNKNGAYVRNRTTPINPNTAKQSTVRSGFASVAAAWRSATSAQRGGWDTLAASNPYVDSLGQSQYYSGFQLYMKLNQNLLAIGGSIINDAPAVPSIPSISLATSFSIETGPVDTITVTPTFSASAADFTLIINGTSAKSAGVNSFKRGDYKFLQVDAGPTTAVAIDCATTWGALFGPLSSAVGSKVSVQARLVHTASGWTSPVVNVNTIVVDNS